jgi:hypothetical protein
LTSSLYVTKGIKFWSTRLPRQLILNPFVQLFGSRPTVADVEKRCIRLPCKRGLYNWCPEPVQVERCTVQQSYRPIAGKALELLQDLGMLSAVLYRSQVTRRY